MRLNVKASIRLIDALHFKPLNSKSSFKTGNIFGGYISRVISYQWLM